MESFRSVDTTGLWIAASVPGTDKIENGGYYSRAAVAAMDPNERHHFSCGVFLPGKTTHLVQYAIEFPFVLNDDVGRLPPNFRPGIDKSVHGVKIDSDEFLFMPTSWIVETSAHNHQYGYQIKPAMTLWQAKLVNMAMKLDPRFAESAKDLSVIQYARLPTGRNSKANRGNFPTRLVSRDPDVTYTFDEYVKGLHLDIDAAAAALAPKKAVASAEKCSVETMKAILDAMPNTFSRPDWTGICHAIQNTLGEDGRDVWIEWSETFKKPGDPSHVAKSGEAERVWETLPADHQNDLGSLRKILIDLHGEDSDVVRTIKGRISNEQSGGFTAIDPADIPASASVSPDARKEEAAKKKLADLLKEARVLSKVPPQHANDDDDNWLDKDGKPIGITATLGIPQTELPTIFAPHAKGQMTMLAGPPAKGKSLLALAQGMAVIYDDQKLLRTGNDRLRFAGDVFYFCNEDALSVLRRRADGFVQRHGLRGVKPTHDLFPLRSMLLSKAGETTTIECLRVVEAMVEHLRGGRSISMVIIDTLPSSMLGVEENSMKEMAEVLILMRRIAHAFWCDVTFIHHGVKASWDGKPEDQRSLSAMSRGTGSTMGNVRAAIGLFDPTDAERGTLGGKIVAEHIAKASDGQQGYTACLYRIETVQIDVLDATTGAVVPADVPVLVALGTPAATAFSGSMTQAEEDVWVDKLVTCPVRMRRYARGASNGQMGSDSVHRVLGVPNDMAWNILDQLCKRKRVKIETEKVNRNNQDYVVVIDENGVF